MLSANPKDAKHYQSPVREPGGWTWKRKPEKPFGSEHQKYSKCVIETVIWWLYYLIAVAKVEDESIKPNSGWQKLKILPKVGQILG